ncbi:MAG: glycosyltransferase family 87 protein [Spirosomataceae bacterium]
MLNIWKKPATRWIVVGLLVVIAFILSVREGMSEDTHGDFYIFWSAGLNFWQGNALYSRVGGAEEFLYPPFAPMIFQVLALLPFQISAVCFTFLNFGLWFLSFRTVGKILRHYFPDTNFKSTLWFTFFVTIRFFWHNIIWVNINEITLTLSLFGILFYLRGKETAAILCFSAGAWLKVMPGFMLLLIALKGNFKTWVKIFLVSLSVPVMIIVQRGVGQGIQDFYDFFGVVLQPFLEGKVYTDWISFSISSMVFKLLTAHPDVDGVRYYIADLPFSTARLISITLQLVVFAVILGRILRNRFVRKQTQISLVEWIQVMLGMLLLAGVSWEGHHVRMVLEYPAIFLILAHQQKFTLRKVTMGLCLVVGFMTLDVLGTRFYDMAQGFSVITFLMLYLLVVSTLCHDVFPSQRMQVEPELEKQD